MKVALALMSVALVAGCANNLPPSSVDVVQVAAQCEARARGAKGPTGAASVGFNNKSGMSTGLAINFTSDYLSGRDPMQVYESCVYERTGEAPFRPPVLD